MKKIKSENQILIMLALLSISIGLWENFRQLWLQDNGFSATDISNIISIGTLVSVLGIIFVGKYIKLERLKTFVTCSLLIKFFNLLFLLKLNNTANTILINISLVIDVLTGYLITTSIYPLITTIVKNNTVYSKRKLTEYLFKDVGVLIGGLLIGKNIIGILVNYNVCLFISIIFLGSSIIVMLNMTACKQIENKQEAKTSILKYILKSKLQIIYMIYTFIGAMALSTSLGLKMLTLTNYFKFTDNQATNYLLIVGLLADLIGILALKYFTPKNDYITITIKFGIRLIGYIIAFLSNNVIIILIAMTWSILISTAYENICDGYYINAVSNEYQFRYTNFRHIIRYLGEAVGVFLCGLMYEIGLKYMFGLSAIFIAIQITLAYILIYMRKHSIRIICEKNQKIQYKERKCAYAIIYDDEGNIAIANDGKYFFFGGGTEEKETALQTLKREMIEETGYTIKDVKLFEKLISYEYNSSRGNLKIVATIYTAKLNKKIAEPTEKDHKILWGKPEQFIDIMYHKYQRVMLKEYSEKINKEKEVEKIC